MPENMRDTPAKWEENDTYLRDPTDPHGKPFSTKQERANQQHARRTTLYKMKSGVQIVQKFDRDEAEAAQAEGWSDVPFIHPNNPDHKAPGAVEEVEVESTPEIDVLRGTYKDLTGEEPDKRWGNKRLKDEILKADDG